MDQTYNSINLIKLIFKWKYHLLVIFVLSLVLSFIFSGSYFIKPKYKSYSVIYPSNLIPYSSETPTEQMLQMFRSDDIRNTVVDKFDLIDHYNIDTNRVHYLTTIKKKFESNVTIEKTRYESVLIEVMDTDPVMARDIINEMVDQFNMKVRALQRGKTSEVMRIWDKALQEKKEQLDSLDTKLTELRTKNSILDYEMQTKEATRGYVASVKSVKAEGLLDKLKEVGGEYKLLQDHLEMTTEAYNDIKLEYEQSVRDMTKELTYSNIVSKPAPADKKSYPIRWLIMLIVCISSLILSILLIILSEKYRSFKDQIINQ